MDNYSVHLITGADTIITQSGNINTVGFLLNDHQTS